MTSIISKISVYLIAPIMVIMTTWFIKLFPIYSIEIFGVVFALSFFLLMVIVADFKQQNRIEDSQTSQNKKESKENSLLTKEVIKEVSIYMLLALIAGTLFDFLSRTIIPNTTDYSALTIPLVVFTVFSLLLVFIHHKVSGDNWNFTFFAILIFFIALAALQLYAGLLPENMRPILFKLHTITLTTYAIFVFHGVARVLTRPVNLIRKNQLSPKKHLILFVSVLYSKSDVNYWKTLTKGLTINKALKNKKLLEIAQYAMNNRKFNHSWEMLLRSIAYHLEPESKKSKVKLKQITLLASSGKVPMKDQGLMEKYDEIKEKIEVIEEEITQAKGNKSNLQKVQNKLNILKNRQKELGYFQNSMDQVHHFIDFLEEYIKINKIKLNIQLLIMDKSNKPSILTGVLAQGDEHDNKLGIEFNDFEEVYNGLMCIHNNIENKRYKQSETVIDFTGGQKSTTAAATLLAVSSSVRNQYVNTNGEKEVIGYNFINENPVQGA